MQFDLRSLIEHMGGVAWGVVIVLAIMSIYSIGVMIERYWTFDQATKQSRKYAPEVARLLKQGKIKEAIDASHGAGVKHSHLAKVLVLGLQEWQYQQEMGEVERDKEAAVDSAKRAIQRATAVNLADLKRGLSGLATIGSTAPFVGLFGTTFGIINAFSGMALTGSGGIGAIAAGIAEALITTAFGLMVAIPAVWSYNYFTTKIENLTVEMTYGSKELIDYLIKSVGSEFGRSIFTKEFQAQKAVTGSGHIHG
jgi:biopolymer transport protein ExbB